MLRRGDRRERFPSALRPIASFVEVAESTLSVADECPVERTTFGGCRRCRLDNGMRGTWCTGRRRGCRERSRAPR